MPFPGKNWESIFPSRKTNGKAEKQDNWLSYRPLTYKAFPVRSHFTHYEFYLTLRFGGLLRNTLFDQKTLRFLKPDFAAVCKLHFLFADLEYFLKPKTDWVRMLLWKWRSAQNRGMNVKLAKKSSNFQRILPFKEDIDNEWLKTSVKWTWIKEATQTRNGTRNRRNPSIN